MRSVPPAHANAHWPLQQRAQLLPPIASSLRTCEAGAAVQQQATASQALRLRTARGGTCKANGS